MNFVIYFPYFIFRLFVEAQKLKVLKANHNLITYFPEDIGKTVIEELNLEHNRLEAIPSELFMKASKYVLRKYLLLNAIYFINAKMYL